MEELLEDEEDPVHTEELEESDSGFDPNETAEIKIGGLGDVEPEWVVNPFQSMTI